MIHEEAVREALKKVKDPEIGMDIVALGLIRKITPDEEGVEILMTLTSPFCPYADRIVHDAEKTVSELDNAGDVRVEITFDPPWEPPEDIKSMMQLH